MILTVISVGECGARWEDFRQPLLKPRDLRLILDRVGSCGRLGPAGLVLSFVCLPGLLHARDASGDVIRESGGRIYTIHLFRIEAGSRRDRRRCRWRRLPRSGEVTAVYDSTACEIHLLCGGENGIAVWVASREGVLFLLPPIATIRIYATLCIAVAGRDCGGSGRTGVTRSYGRHSLNPGGGLHTREKTYRSRSVATGRPRPSPLIGRERILILN